MGFFGARSGERSASKWENDLHDLFRLIVLPFVILWWIGKIIYWIIVWSVRLFSKR